MLSKFRHFAKGTPRTPKGDTLTLARASNTTLDRATGALRVLSSAGDGALAVAGIAGVRTFLGGA